MFFGGGCRLDLVGPTEPLFNLSTKSPAGNYVVQLERKRREGNWTDLWTWKLFLSVQQQGMQTLSHQIVSVGDDSSHTGFPHRIIPELTWVAENVIRLTGKNTLPDSQCDQLFIRNNTKRVLRYFSIEGGETKFFWLNVQPNESIQPFTQPQSDQGRDHSFFGADGISETGEKIGIARSFEVRGKYKQPGHYCFTINEEGVDLVSLEFEGWDLVFDPEDEKKFNELLAKQERTEAEEKLLGDLLRNKQRKVITPSSPTCGTTRGKE